MSRKTCRCQIVRRELFCEISPPDRVVIRGAVGRMTGPTADFGVRGSVQGCGRHDTAGRQAPREFGIFVGAVRWPAVRDEPRAGRSRATAADSGGSYKDGTYSATGTYVSPGGQQSIGVTVTLESGKVTALELDRSHTKGTSATFQGKFASGINDLVIGKSIDDLDDISKVSGSSLTSGGFKKAIAQIKEDAAE